VENVRVKLLSDENLIPLYESTSVFNVYTMEEAQNKAKTNPVTKDYLSYLLNYADTIIDYGLGVVEIELKFKDKVYSSVALLNKDGQPLYDHLLSNICTGEGTIDVVTEISKDFPRLRTSAPSEGSSESGNEFHRNFHDELTCYWTSYWTDYSAGSKVDVDMYATAIVKMIWNPNLQIYDNVIESHYIRCTADGRTIHCDTEGTTKGEVTGIAEVRGLNGWVSFSYGLFGGKSVSSVSYSAGMGNNGGSFSITYQSGGFGYYRTGFRTFTASDITGISN
jgi:hypothetical protein